MSSKALTVVAQYIKNAKVLIFTNGSGLSADSGINTFRGINTGIWHPLTRLNITNQEMSCPMWFEDNEAPSLAFGFWKARYDQYVLKSKPHEGYNLLLNWATLLNKPYFVYTSNIDGHWLASGVPETNIVEIHGSIRYQQCRDNCSNQVWEGPIDCAIDPETSYALDPLPICPNCKKSITRPNVHMFEDYGCNFSRINGQKANWLNWPFKKSQGITVIEVGAGTTIPTIRKLSETIVKQHKTNRLIRINLEEAELGSVEESQGVSLQLGALAAIRTLDKLIKD